MPAGFITDEFGNNISLDQVRANATSKARDEKERAKLLSVIPAEQRSAGEKALISQYPDLGTFVIPQSDRIGPINPTKGNTGFSDTPLPNFATQHEFSNYLQKTGGDLNKTGIPGNPNAPLAAVPPTIPTDKKAANTQAADQPAAAPPNPNSGGVDQTKTITDQSGSGGNPLPTMPAGNPFQLPTDPTLNMPTPEELGAQQGQYYNAFLPSYQGMGIIQDQLGGKLSQSLKDQLWQAGAERGVAMGSPEGANTNAALLRAMGLTTEQLQQQGLTNLNAAYKLAAPLNPLGQAQQKLESYVAQLNQYGATARQIMQEDTQMALQKLIGSQNMDLETKRELGAQALAKINNDFTMTRQDKALAQDMVIELRREAQALQLATMQGQTARDVAAITASGRGGGGGGGGKTTGDTTANDAAMRALVNEALRRTGMKTGGGDQTTPAGGGEQPPWTVPPPAPRPPNTGTITSLSSTELSSVGWDAPLIKKMGDLGWTGIETQDVFDELKHGGYSIADEQLAKQWITEGYTADQIIGGLRDLPTPGPLTGEVPVTGPQKGPWHVDPSTGVYSWVGYDNTGTNVPELPSGLTPDSYWTMTDAQWNALSPSDQQALEEAAWQTQMTGGSTITQEPTGTVTNVDPTKGIIQPVQETSNTEAWTDQDWADYYTQLYGVPVTVEELNSLGG